MSRSHRQERLWTLGSNGILKRQPEWLWSHRPGGRRLLDGGAGVSKGKSEKLPHREGKGSETTPSRSGGQRQSQPVPQNAWLAWSKGPQPCLCAGWRACVGVLEEEEEAEPPYHGRAGCAGWRAYTHTHIHTHRHTDASCVNHPACESAPRIPVGE